MSPNDPDLCYATDLGRTLRTTDGGKNWDAVYSKPSGGAWTSTGLDVTTAAYGCADFDPFDSRRMFITYTDIGAFRSEDGGKSWQSATQGVPKQSVNTTYWMAFDPKVRGRVWAVASGTHDLPRPKMWRRTGVAPYRGGVIRATTEEDVAGVERRHAGGRGNAHSAGRAVGRRQAQIVCGGIRARHSTRSEDGGATWSLKNNGIAGEEPFAWRLAQTPSGGLYAVVARRSEDGSIGTPGDGALYFSKDGADHWTRVMLPEGVNGPNSLTVDPRDERRLYLSSLAA